MDMNRDIPEITEELLESEDIQDAKQEEISAPADEGNAPAIDPDGQTEIVSIRFRDGGKSYFFAPGEFRLSAGDRVVTDTARGPEYGFVTSGNRMVKNSEIVSPLKAVIRMATDADTARYEENMQKRQDAFRIFNDKVREHNIDMRLVDVEYTFDNSKILFYFTADGRVDFRDLVKDLASVFRTRIELRQIGIRDEAKLIGGLGICGRPLCCHSFLSDFVQVSIKMAKEQNLSLNSAKISGTCGRLMCCLRYEHDVYEEEIAKTPKVDSVVMTPDGEAIVTEVNPLAGTVRVRFTGTRSDMPPKLFSRDDVQKTELTKKDIRQREMAQRSQEQPQDTAEPSRPRNSAASPVLNLGEQKEPENLPAEAAGQDASRQRQNRSRRSRQQNRPPRQNRPEQPNNAGSENEQSAKPEPSAEHSNDGDGGQKHGQGHRPYRPHHRGHGDRRKPGNGQNE